MVVLWFPILLVPFGIWVLLQWGLVLEACLHCIYLLYVRHSIFSRVLYFPVSFSFNFWSLFFPHSFCYPLNLLLGVKALCQLPYLELVLVIVLVWYLVCCCTSCKHIPLVWLVCWRVWLASTLFVPRSAAVFLNYLSHCKISLLNFLMLDYAF